MCKSVKFKDIERDNGMERINGNELEPNNIYYIELDNDSLRQYGAYKAKHYGTFIKYNNNYAYFENINVIKNSLYLIEKKDRKFVGGVYWKFFKMKKHIIEKRITNSIIQEIIGDTHFYYIN